MKGDLSDVLNLLVLVVSESERLLDRNSEVCSEDSKVLM